MSMLEPIALALIYFGFAGAGVFHVQRTKEPFEAWAYSTVYLMIATCLTVVTAVVWSSTH